MSPDLRQLFKRVGVGVRAPRHGPEGIADGADGFLRGEGNDHDEDERDDAAQAEQGKDNVHDGLCARADGIETVIFLFHQAAPP